MRYDITRFALSEAQNHKCCYCPCTMTMESDDSPTMATREHVIPRAFGGETVWDNLVAACRECNSLRGHMDAQAFYWMRQQMSPRDILRIRAMRLAREDRKYRLIARTDVAVAWTFFKRWSSSVQNMSRAES